MDIQNQFQPQQFSQQENKKTVLGIILIIAILAVIGAAMAYYYLEKTNKEEETKDYPILESSTKTFQGKASIDLGDMYFTFDDEYMKNYKTPSSITKIKESERENYYRTLIGEPYVNYLYSPENISIQKIIKNIVPVKGNEVFISIYNPAKDACLTGNAGFYTYKESSFNDTITIKDPEKTIIKPYCVFTLKIKDNTQIWGLKNYKDFLSESDFENVMEQFKDVNGWILLPMPKSDNFLKTFKESSKNRIRIAKEIIKAEEISIEGEKNTVFKENSFAGENRQDLTTFKIDGNAYIAWVKLDAPMKCNKEEYSVGEICKKCPNPKYTDRECTMEKTGKGEIAFWHFNEGSGKSLKDSAGFNDGEINSATWDKGIEGKTLKFDGEKSLVEIKSDSIDKKLNTVSFSAWIKLNKQDQISKIIAKGNNGISFDKLSGFRAGFKINDKNFVINMDSSTPPRMDQWHHVVATYDGREIKLYINGVNVKSLEKEGNIDWSDEPIFIGSGNGEKYFSGMIDEIAIFNKALTKDEVKELYNKYIKE